MKIEIDITNINPLFLAFVWSMLIIRALKSILTSSTLLNLLPLQLLDNIIIANINCKAITNYIYAVLLLNIL